MQTVKNTLPWRDACYPLGRIDTEEEQRWAVNWLEQAVTGEGLVPTLEERKELWEAVQRLAALPAPQRTLSIYRQLLQIQRLKIGLEPLCRDARIGAPTSY